MAAHCKLADVIPNTKDAQWSDEARNFFINAVEGKLLAVCINEKNIEKRISVNLIEYKDGEQRTINSLLISAKHALGMPQGPVKRFSSHQFRLIPEREETTNSLKPATFASSSSSSQLFQNNSFFDKLEAKLTLPFRVTYVETPFSFYGCFPYGLTDLEQLGSNILLESSEKRCGDLEMNLIKLRADLRFV